MQGHSRNNCDGKIWCPHQELWIWSGLFVLEFNALTFNSASKSFVLLTHLHWNLSRELWNAAHLVTCCDYISPAAQPETGVWSYYQDGLDRDNNTSLRFVHQGSKDQISEWLIDCWRKLSRLICSLQTNRDDLEHCPPASYLVRVLSWCFKTCLVAFLTAWMHAMKYQDTKTLLFCTVHYGALLGEFLTFNLKHQSIECHTWLNPDSLVD